MLFLLFFPKHEIMSADFNQMTKIVDCSAVLALVQMVRSSQFLRMKFLCSANSALTLFCIMCNVFFGIFHSKNRISPDSLERRKH